MKIITIHAHDSFNADLCSVPDTEWYHLTNKKAGHRLWGGGARPQPTNLHEVPYENLSDVDWSQYDVLLIQTLEQYNLLKDVPIKMVYLEHTVPFPLFTGDAHGPIRTNPNVRRIVYLTEMQVLAWKSQPLDVDVIMPSIDVSAYEEWSGTDKRILTVCNSLPARDWCCGYTVWKYNTHELPRILVGEGNEKIVDQSSVAGFIPYPDIKNYFRDCVCYFNTNLHSPVGTSLLEAMATGMPIVSTDTWLAHSHLHNGSEQRPQSAWLSNVQPQLRRWLRNITEEATPHEELAKVGQQARKIAQEFFAPDRFREEWKELLEDVCNG